MLCSDAKNKSFPFFKFTYLVAERMYALPLSLPDVHPLETRLSGEIASEALAPLEVVCHLVVGQVPARVLHEGHGDPGVDGVLGVGPRHRLVLTEEILKYKKGNIN